MTNPEIPDNENPFNNHAPAPRDVVPGSGLTREDVLVANSRVGTVVHGTLPGEVVLDADGIPAGVGPSRPISSYYGGLVITQQQADELGLTREDIPNITIQENSK